MYKIQTLNAISPVIYNHLNQDAYTVVKETADPDAVIVRSASMLEMEMPKSLLSIARAGAGYNNIPVDKCTELGICVFNTPGANANAVKELVLAGLLLASRDVIGGIEWAKTLQPGATSVAKQVEKGKGQFVGPEISGKTRDNERRNQPVHKQQQPRTEAFLHRISSFPEISGSGFQRSDSLLESEYFTESHHSRFSSLVSSAGTLTEV